MVTHGDVRFCSPRHRLGLAFQDVPGVPTISQALRPNELGPTCSHCPRRVDGTAPDALAGTGDLPPLTGGRRAVLFDRRISKRHDAPPESPRQVGETGGAAFYGSTRTIPTSSMFRRNRFSAEA